MKEASVSPCLGAALVEKSRLAVWAELVKARLTLLVLITTAVGFYLGTPGRLDALKLGQLLLGTALLAGGAAALNQYLERDHDARMRRTRDRPLPSGRLTPRCAVVFGIGSSLLGLGVLAVTINHVAALVGAVTLLTYVAVYTPLKRRTWLNTWVGAIPGALPPLLGWAAATGAVGPEGWWLFLVQGCWQVPHFLAIAWLYRDEYAHAGFRMLPSVDPSGARTARQTVAFALAVLAASTLPWWANLCGPTYLIGALALGTAFAGLSVRFARRLDRDAARLAFLASITYLPLLLVLMVWDKVK